MYGLPLTIYFLTTYLPIRVPLVHDSGHLWAALVGYGRNGDIVEMAIGSVFIIAGLVLIVREWIRIYVANGAMASDGIYRLVGHPQYTGIILAVLCRRVYWPTTPTLLLSPAIIWPYVGLARREERYLIDKFGNAYRAYRKKEPMFFPRWRDLHHTVALR